MSIEQVNEFTGISNVLPDEYGWIEKLFAKYVVPGAEGTTDGLMNAVQLFFTLYLNNPRDLYSGLNVSGGTGDVYKVKYDSSDLEGYLNEKLFEGLGIKLELGGTSNKTVTFTLDIQQPDSLGASLLKNPSTIKRIQEGTGIEISDEEDELIINIDEAFLDAITYGIKYAWDTEAEMLAETDMTEGDLGVRRDLFETWRYDGIEWSYMFDLGSATVFTTVTDPSSESYTGIGATQQAVNQEVVQNLNNLYNLILGQSPAYGDLIGDPLPQPITSTESVATWSTVNQSTDTDVWEFNDTLNEVLVKKAGFYTWNTQVEITNGSNQDRFLIFSTRDKNNPGTYFYTRSIIVPRDGTNSQSSIQFEVANDNTIIEIMAHGETNTGAGSTSLTFQNWETSLILDFLLSPEFDLETDLIDVSNPTLESLSETATKQSGINIENKVVIELLQDDVATLDTGDVDLANPSTESVSGTPVSQLDLNIENKGLLEGLLANSGKQNVLQYEITKSTGTPSNGEIFYNTGTTVSIKVHEGAFGGGLHGLFEFLKQGSVFNVYSKATDNTYIKGKLVADPVLNSSVYSFELEDYIVANYTTVDPLDVKVCIDFMNVGGDGGGTASELSGSFAKSDHNLEVTQEVSNDTWEILDIGSFTTIDSVDFDTDIIWDDTNKRILNNGTTTKKVKVSFTTNISLSPEGGVVTEDNLLVAVRDSVGDIITSSYMRESDTTNLNDSKHFSGSYTLDLTPNNWLRLECLRDLVSASSDFIIIYDFTFSAVEIGNSVASGVDENVKVSDTDTTTGKLIDKISAGSNVTITKVDEGGDEKLLITSSGEVSSIVKQGVNYYNLGNDICNNVNGVGQEIANISSVNNNGTGWLVKSPNGNVLTDIPTVANVTYADGLSPAIPILDNTKAIQMKLRTGNCRVFDTNRNDKTGIAYVEINIFELDSQSIISTNHSLIQTVQLMDSFGANNTSVVGSGQTSNSYVTFVLTNLNGIFSLDSTKQYGFTISGTSDQNPPKSLEKIMLMDTALLTIIYEGEVL